MSDVNDTRPCYVRRNILNEFCYAFVRGTGEDALNCIYGDGPEKTAKAVARFIKQPAVVVEFTSDVLPRDATFKSEAKFFADNYGTDDQGEGCYEKLTGEELELMQTTYRSEIEKIQQEHQK